MEPQNIIIHTINRHEGGNYKVGKTRSVKETGLFHCRVSFKLINMRLRDTSDRLATTPACILWFSIFNNFEQRLKSRIGTHLNPAEHYTCAFHSYPT